MLVARKVGAGYRKKKCFMYISESYPPIRLDDITFYKASDLHLRVYRVCLKKVYRNI